MTPNLRTSLAPKGQTSIAQWSRLGLVLALALPIWTPTLSAQSPVKLGAPFAVNTFTTLSQDRAQVAMQGNGDFIVVWESQRSDNGDDLDFSIQGQRFASDGSMIGDRFLVNAYTTNNQRQPAIAMATDRSFVVVWQSYGSGDGDTEHASVQGRRFASDGSPFGDQFQVNSYTPQGQIRAQIAMDAADNFVVVWEQNNAYGAGAGFDTIEAQRFLSDGTPAGSQLSVSEPSDWDQERPQLAVDANGDFVVVWHADGPTGDDTSLASIQGRRFDSLGVPLGTQFVANTYTTGNQIAPDISMQSAGDFVVVWNSDQAGNGDSSERSIQGQRFASDGTPQGNQFLINTYTTGIQWGPTVHHDAGDGFVVTWQNYLPANGPYNDILGQRFTSNGTSLGEEFHITPAPEIFGGYPSLASDSAANFVVVWQSYHDGDSDYGLLAQRFCNPSCLFVDGFESGDTMSWSGSMGE